MPPLSGRLQAIKYPRVFIMTHYAFCTMTSLLGEVRGREGGRQRYGVTVSLYNCMLYVITANMT